MASCEDSNGVAFLINPWRTCAARVIVLGWLSVCPPVTVFSATSGQELVLGG